MLQNASEYATPWLQPSEKLFRVATNMQGPWELFSESQQHVTCRFIGQLGGAEGLLSIKNHLGLGGQYLNIVLNLSRKIFD
jgi:hypothetical protein